MIGVVDHAEIDAVRDFGRIDDLLLIVLDLAVPGRRGLRLGSGAGAT
jgi:hypothetical protein